MDLNNWFCKICSYQFGKKLVYDIHMSFVHKIEIPQSNSEKLAEIKKKGNNLLENAIASESGEKFVEQNNINIGKEDSKLFKCSICNFFTSQKSSLQQHIESASHKHN